jgi:hypothetical protein
MERGGEENENVKTERRKKKCIYKSMKTSEKEKKRMLSEEKKSICKFIHLIKT